jgi:MYXO-CTERM domain-containing protein
MARWKGWAVFLLGAAVWLGGAPAAEAQGGPEVAEARRLDSEVTTLYAAGKYEAAIPLAERALAIWERALGPDHPETAATVNNLAELYSMRGDYARAERLFQRSLAALETTFGPDHPHLTNPLNNLAGLYYARGDYGRAEPLLQRALTILEKALGPDHPEVARSLDGLASLRWSKGEYDRAEPLFQRALAIREKALGPNHPEVAQSLNSLATLYEKRAEHDRAEPLFQRALAITEKIRGPEHPEVATSLHNLAMLWMARGDYSRAEPLFRRALGIAEKALGPDSLTVAAYLENLAALYENKEQHGLAEPLYRRALAIAERAQGPDGPTVAACLANLAELYGKKGEYDRAEPLYRRALAILERVLGPDHPDVAAVLNNLAELRRKEGAYDRAEPLFQRALTILERAWGPNHLAVATTRNNLALVYEAKGEHGRAEALLQHALAIAERAPGPDHLEVAAALNNLAALYTQKGEHDRAEPLYQRALVILEKALGPDRPSLAATLDNLALLYQAKGDHGRAESTFQRARVLLEQALGPDHPDVAVPLTNLATLYWTTGRLSEAVLSLTRGQDVEERTLGRVVATGSEAQKRAYLATLAGTTHAPVSLALQTRDPRASRLALTTLLRRKGRALDAMTLGVGALRARLGPEEQRLFDELQAARARYVTLALRGPGTTPLQPYRDDLARLDARIQEGEAAISERSAAFHAEQQPITVDVVQTALPEATALVEWAVYAPMTAQSHAGPARYAACVLRKEGDPVWVDLGAAASLAAEIAALRGAFRRPANDDAAALARALDARVMAPVRALLGDTRRVFLSPDGALNLVPFAALVGDDGRPLIERYAFTYLTSGRDLLRLSVRTPARQGPLILAGPDFDLGAAPGAGRFSPLLHADEEAAAASRVLPGATVLRHDQATKANLQKARGPRLLHIGTHGYFEPIACSAQSDPATLANPLLQSGIALAGANACASGHDEGLLTALEASGLDLYGTQLAVLSACQTGVGDAKAGDGVYGLRRALVLAGAETQVMSLWPVQGDTTSALMKAYYEALARGGGRSEAMRTVQLAMLHGERRHPYYWASFIVSGDDRSLEDKPPSPDLRVHPGGACACRMGEEAPDGRPVWLSVAAVLGSFLARRRSGARDARGWRALRCLALGMAAWLGAVCTAEAQSRTLDATPGATETAAAPVDEARRLSGEAIALHRAGKYYAAIPLAERALTIFEKALGLDHLDVATVLDNLAQMHESAGEYERAEQLFQRALTIREKGLGSDHPQVGIALNNLAELYVVKGDYARALPRYERSRAILENALGPDHPLVAFSLGNLAMLYKAIGELARAEQLGVRSLAILEKVRDRDDPDVGTALDNLAEVYEDSGKLDRAEPLLARSLAILENVLGSEHPRVATALHNLATLFDLKGEYDRAEPLYQRALAIRETRLGPSHPNVAATLSNLGLMHADKGAYARAELLLQRALAIREQTLGPSHPDVAVTLDNLALSYAKQRVYDSAEPLYLRALAIQEKALGADHPAVATTLDGLATLYTSKGEHDRAELLFRRALAVREKRLGEGHPDVATVRNNLAGLALRRGDYAGSESLYRRSFDALTTALGPEHPLVGKSAHNLATVHWAAGHLEEARIWMARGQDVQDRTLTRVVATGSEAQKRAFLGTVAGTRDGAVTFAVLARDRYAAPLALNALLRQKGRALDAMADNIRTVRARMGPDQQKTFDELDAARSQYVTLALRGPGKLPLGAYRDMLLGLDAEIQRREAAISDHRGASRAEQMPISATTVQVALPKDSALVEWTVYKPFDPRAHSSQETWAAPRYAACVLSKRGDSACVDLGDATAIEADIQALRVALRRPANKDVGALARSLEARVMAPVRALVGDVRRLFLSPDGALNLVPFAALIGDDGRPLVERYAFTYLTSGRDLLRAPAPPRGGPLALANPAFDAGGPPGAGRFPPLLHAEEEATAFSQLFPGSTVLLHDRATKASLQKAHGPLLLHIGTHGYFEAMACSAEPDKAAIDNPLLRSGLALAGANACASGRDEGLLTAFEASGLDLYGTKLAVLSACQTGVGAAKAGDGVYGLRRALVLAGAETQVMSLWPVDGAATADLMKAYYEALAKGGGRSEAMRQVQLAMLHQPGREHPYYWASFIVSGDDRSLDDKAVAPDLRVHSGGACVCGLGREAPDGRAMWLAFAGALAWVGRRWRRGVSCNRGRVVHESRRGGVVVAGARGRPG